ncbi:MAG: ribonuclease P protein subunit [Euryarchaeota archaeon]|nr:ribonuclease P protein subunit [Euryarchaeota archaeon]
MEITERNVEAAELIGRLVKVTGSHDAGLLGVEGSVVDETMNTFAIETRDGKEVIVPKAGQSFTFDGAYGATEIQGSVLARRPEDRIRLVNERAPRRKQ